MGIRKIKSLEYDLVRLGIIFNIWWLGCKLYKNPYRSFKVVKKLVQNFSKMIGHKKLVRAYKIDGKYAWDMFNPAWPSKGFNAFFTNHLIEVEPTEKDNQSLRRLLIAITKRCPLQCEHCSEGATLYQNDILTYEEFISKIDSFVAQNVGQLVYSGGEPLSRFDDLVLFLKRYKNTCDQWIYTSAFGLTEQKAKQLKLAGLNGAAISLDHHEEAEHNRFRGNKQSYQMVLNGIKHLQDAGILVAINVCATKQYIDSGGVEKIIELAKNLEIPIVNFLEPRAVGNYQDKEVELEPKHMDYLAKLSEKYNFEKQYFDFPTVLFPAAYRKSMPCGGGKSYLLLDFDGSLYPCPFCKVKMPTINAKVDLCKAS